MVTRALPIAEEQEKVDLEAIEVLLLTQGIYKHYGFDFRDYSLPSLRRRLWKRVFAEGLSTISALQDKVLHDSSCMERLLLDLSINTTAMFRDPTFYQAFRQKIVPLLRTYPFVRIWHAGCSTGEEVYSMAMLLQEEGLYERSRIYATDINEAVLRSPPPAPPSSSRHLPEASAGRRRSFASFVRMKTKRAGFVFALVGPHFIVL